MMERMSNSFTVQSVLAKTKYHILYLVKENVTGKSFVVKTLNENWQRDETAGDCLRQQALTGKKLKHSHICETIDYIDRDNKIHILREWMKGSDLRSVLEQGLSLPTQTTVIDWLRQILKALIYAHAQGIYHCHINPDSIFIMEDGSVKLHGFAQARHAWLRADLGKAQFHPVHYISPELYDGEDCRNTSDIYSLGVLGYQLLTGRLPWHLDKSLEPLQQKPLSFTRPVIDPDLLGAKVPHWQYTILNKALAVDPDRRFQTCSQMLKAIEAETDVGYQPPQRVITVKVVPEPVTPVPDVLPEQMEILPVEPEAVSFTEPITEDEPDRSIPMITVENTEDQPGKNIGDEKEESPDEIPVPQPVPEPKPVVRPPAIPITIGKDNEGQELSRMKKKFVILMILSLVIIVFITVKYFVTGSEPTFSGERTEPQGEAKLSDQLLPNELIPMVFVRGDTAVVGSMAPEANPDEFPLRQMVLKSFYIGRFEVTQRQWRMVFDSNPSRFKDDDQPVENVSFYDVVEFCNQKSILDRLQPCYEIIDTQIICNFDANGYRLPTEVEWEFAAKSGMQYVDEIYSGSIDPDQVGWSNINSNASTNPVGGLSPNKLGIHDLSGNVYEWVWNWYARYSAGTQDFYAGPQSGTDKVIRGGSWYHEKHEMRITARSYAKPFTKANYIGFRIVRNAK